MWYFKGFQRNSSSQVTLKMQLRKVIVISNLVIRSQPSVRRKLILWNCECKHPVETIFGYLHTKGGLRKFRFKLI